MTRWVCRNRQGRGLSVLFVYPDRGGPEFGIELCDAGAAHELRFADEESAGYFLQVASNAFPHRTSGFRVWRLN